MATNTGHDAAARWARVFGAIEQAAELADRFGLPARQHGNETASAVTFAGTPAEAVGKQGNHEGLTREQV